jgi:hypothetical protein
LSGGTLKKERSYKQIERAFHNKKRKPMIKTIESYSTYIVENIALYFYWNGQTSIAMTLLVLDFFA